MRIFIRRAKRIFESNNVPFFLWNSVYCRLCAAHIWRIHLGDILQTTDYWLSTRSKSDLIKLDLISDLSSRYLLFPISFYVYFPCQRIEWRSSRQYDRSPRNHYRGSMKISFHIGSSFFFGQGINRRIKCYFYFSYWIKHIVREIIANIKGIKTTNIKFQNSKSLNHYHV